MLTQLSPVAAWREITCPEPTSRGFARIQVWRPSGNVARVQVLYADEHELTYWDEMRGEKGRIETKVKTLDALGVLCSCIEPEAAEIARLLWRWRLQRFDLYAYELAATGS